MKKIKSGNVISIILLLILFWVVYQTWFKKGLISSFDFPFYPREMIQNVSISLFAWNWHFIIDGFSGFISPYSWIFPVLNFPQVIFGKLGFDWIIIERISYLYPLLVLLFFSPIIFTKYFFPKNNFYLISILIFSFNTYSLLLSGGEIFLALSYCLMPIVFILFSYLLKISNKKNISKYKYTILTALLFTVQTMIETRVAFITIISVILYFLFYCLVNIKSFEKSKIKKYFYNFIFIFLMPVIISLLLHAYWIIPTIFYGKNPVEELGSAYSTTEAVRYLSFAKFENAISLLHPNWPENIFGKVYFLKPEFLILPILAYLSLFFVKKLKSREERVCIIFFAFLGLIGTFLSKGVNEPFGSIYNFLFNNFPGFILFRDPSKWYPLIALSYTVLIPFSIWKIYELLKEKCKNLNKNNIFNLQNTFLLAIILYLLFLIKPAISQELGGMLKITSVPEEYVKLETFIVNQKDYFRTLWVPSKQRFSYYSDLHPIISARNLFNIFDNEKLLDELSKNESKEILKQASVKYVVIPYDSEGEIFLEDRKYSQKEYLKTVGEIEKINWLKPVGNFEKIKVFELDNPKDHFWMIGDGGVNYKYISPVEYEVELSNVKINDILVFSESFDKEWSFIFNDSKVFSKKYNLFNSLEFNKNGNYSITVYYEPQKYVDFGLIISGTTLAIIIIFFIFHFLTINSKKMKLI